MADWSLVAVRFGLYGDLGLLFGIPFFTLTARQGAAIWQSLRLGAVLALLAGIGLLLSLFGFALLAAQMSGVSLGALDPVIAQALLVQSVFGWALIARTAALVVALAMALLLPAGRMKCWLLAGLGAIAVATLAWNGHGAGGEGVAGLVHLGGDIVHLLAASAWLGALALLLALVSPGGTMTPGRADLAHAALAGFSRAGTVVVALLVATGITNAVLTVGPDSLIGLGASLYGQLLALKLLLFAAMLSLATLNRYGLTPALQASLERGELRPSLSALRRSVAFETVLALAVLALVAWLGMLEPQPLQ